MSTPKERYEAVYERPAEERRKLERDRDALLAAAKLVLPEIERKTGPSEELDRLRAAIAQAEANQ